MPECGTSTAWPSRTAAAFHLACHPARSEGPKFKSTWRPVKRTRSVGAILARAGTACRAPTADKFKSAGGTNGDGFVALAIFQSAITGRGRLSEFQWDKLQPVLLRSSDAMSCCSQDRKDCDVTKEHRQECLCHLQINYAAVVAVGFAAAAFHLFRTYIALNQIFSGHLRSA